MSVYLRAKFEASGIILTSFRLGESTSTSKRTPKKPSQITVKQFLLVIIYK